MVFKVPQEKVPDITLHLHPSTTIEQCKHIISSDHPFKPEVTKQRILFGGKLLQNEQILSDLIKDKQSREFTFHLMIFSKKYHQPEEEEKKQEQPPEPRRREQQSPDQIVSPRCLTHVFSS